MNIGEVKCLFLSCFYQGRSPILTLGPSWPFTFILLLLSLLILGYFYMMLKLGENGHPLHLFWCRLCVVGNLLCLLAGILKNPGIPQRHIDRILKEKMGKGEDDEEDIEMQDMESGATIKSQKKEIGRSKSMESRLKGFIWCQYCMLETDSNAYHCEDCDVCIEDYDHHCVFFSKCIGGGNINCFWGSLGGVLFNFLNIAIFLGVTASMNGSLMNGPKDGGDGV